MPGVGWSITTRATGTILTSAIYSADRQEIVDHFEPQYFDDESLDVTAMRATADPYPGAVASLPTSLRGELQRIRYVIKQITGQSQWYIDPEQGTPDGFGIEYVSASQVKITRKARKSDGTAAILVTIAGTQRAKTDADLTLDISVAGDREDASEAASTWYYIYLYWDGAALQGKLSSTAPNAQGYHGTQTNWVCVGEVRNNGSSNFEAFVRNGRRVWRTEGYATVLSGGTAIVYTDVDVSAYVPATGVEALQHAFANQSTSTEEWGFRRKGDTAALVYMPPLGTGTLGEKEGMMLIMPLDSSRIFQYSRLGGSGSMTIYLCGYNRWAVNGWPNA